MKKKSGGAALTFPAKWSAVKHRFMEAQYGKCAFCEGRILGLQYGDVEHYRPKGAVELLDHTNPATWGTEAPWSASVKGRETTPHSDTGYWWKAYSWSNYLVSCQVCNQQWKKCIFPTAAPVPRPIPNLLNVETPLLLHPFGKIDPTRHLEFGRMGEVTAYNGSQFGQATILTCGLDRPSLRQARCDLARTTHERVDEIGADITDHELFAILKAIHADGQKEKVHCGMVRAIFCQRMAVSWQDLEKIVMGHDKSPKKPARRLCEC